MGVEKALFLMFLIHGKDSIKGMEDLILIIIARAVLKAKINIDHRKILK